MIRNNFMCFLTFADLSHGQLFIVEIIFIANRKNHNWLIGGNGQQFAWLN